MMGISNEPAHNLTGLSRWLKVLSEPKRLMLLEGIISGLQCNGDLGEAFGMAPNLISHHLSVLREAGLINAERDLVDGRWIYYTVNPTALESLQQLLCAFFDPARIQPLSSACRPRQTDTTTPSIDLFYADDPRVQRINPKTET